MKKIIFTMIFALAGFVRANTITFDGEFFAKDQNPATILSLADKDGVDETVLGVIGDADLKNGGELNATGTITNTFGTFTLVQVDTSQGPQYELTFTMNSGFVLAGVGLHGGGGKDIDFYSINDETSGVLEGLFHTHLNPSGKYAGISNFFIFAEAAETKSTPDGGSTAILLGSTLTALGFARRFFRV